MRPIRVGAFFEQSEDFWYGLQVECDFRSLAKERKRLTRAIRPAKDLVAA